MFPFRFSRSSRRSKSAQTGSISPSQPLESRCLLSGTGISIPVWPGSIDIVETDGATRTSEDGLVDSFDVKLNEEPDGDVLVEITTADRPALGVARGDAAAGSDEVELSTTSLLFTVENWDVAQTVEVSGVNDDLWDDDRVVDIQLAGVGVLVGGRVIEFSGQLDVTNTDDEMGSLAEFDRELVRDAAQRWQHVLGQESDSCDLPVWPVRWLPDGPIALVDDARLTVETATAGDPQNVSDTNTQVAGVDEADIVETDGDFIYSLNFGHLVITSLDSAGNVQVVSRTDLGVDEWSVRGIFLTGERLTVVSSHWNNHGIEARGLVWWPTETGQTSVAVYDVTDRSAPTLQQETIIDGDYRDSRVVGEQLSLILNNRWELPFPEPLCTELDATSTDEVDVNAEATDEAFTEPATHRFESANDYRQRVAPLVRDVFVDNLPGVFERSDRADGESLLRIDDLFTIDDIVSSPTSAEVESNHGVADIAPARLSLWPGNNGHLADYTSISVVDLTSDAAGVADAEAVELPSTAQVYADLDNIYLAWNDWFEGSTTQIHKFDVSAGTVDFSASGAVAGYVSDHFALDEHDGHLRIVTTTSGYEEVDGEQRWVQDHKLFVLQQNVDALEVVGQLSNIGTNETLHAVRYQGDRGFVVTFRNVDPLFTIDLSDPTNPRLMGELIIPGFSDYLQPINDTHLIGIGRDENRNTQVSLFDVSDFANPTRLDTFTFGPRAHTDAIWDHHAVTYTAWDGVLTLPYQTSRRVSNGTNRHGHVRHRYVYETGVEVLQIAPGADGELQIEEIGTINFGDSRDWHDGVRRTIRADDIVFSISGTEIQSHRVEDTSVMIDRADLTLAPGDEALPELDFDGSGHFHFSSDGILLLAYELGMRGSSLETFLGQDVTRTGSQIEDRIARVKDSLDLDDDGAFMFATDGLMLLGHTIGMGGLGLELLASENGNRTATQIDANVGELFIASLARAETPAAEAAGIVSLTDSEGSVTFNAPVTVPSEPRISISQPTHDPDSHNATQVTPEEHEANAAIEFNSNTSESPVAVEPNGIDDFFVGMLVDRQDVFSSQQPFQWIEATHPA